MRVLVDTTSSPSGGSGFHREMTVFVFSFLLRHQISWCRRSKINRKNVISQSFIGPPLGDDVSLLKHIVGNKTGPICHGTKTFYFQPLKPKVNQVYSRRVYTVYTRTYVLLIYIISNLTPFRVRVCVHVSTKFCIY